MAKEKPQPEAPSPEEWTGEELTQMARQLDLVCETVRELKQTVEPLVPRQDRMEADLAAMNPTNSGLPTQVVQGVDPGQFYQSVLAGVFSGWMQTCPSRLLTPSPTDNQARDIRRKMIANCMDIADDALLVLATRMGINGKAKEE